jgi:hypothetical protein
MDEGARAFLLRFVGCDVDGAPGVASPSRRSTMRTDDAVAQ